MTADRKKTICLRIEGFFTRDTTENDLHLASSRISDSALVPVILVGYKAEDDFGGATSVPQSLVPVTFARGQLPLFPKIVPIASYSLIFL